MKLTISGHILDRGQSANFETTVNEFFPSRKMPLPVSDTFYQVMEVGERYIKFRFIRFEDVDELFLRSGNELEYTHHGNAYEYTMKFGLEEGT